LSQTNTLQIQDIRKDRKEIFYALESYKKFYNEREKDSIIRVKNELFESVEKLHNLRLHATPVSLRMYCLIFIYLSPLVYNSHILANFEKNSLLELGIALFFSVLIGFILMALYNIQEYIEDPFDQQGLDDLKFREMSVGEEEILS
jgi:predicted membrane chloride channel (bestrophin family)